MSTLLLLLLLLTDMSQIFTQIGYLADTRVYSQGPSSDVSMNVEPYSEALMPHFVQIPGSTKFWGLYSTCSPTRQLILYVYFIRLNFPSSLYIRHKYLHFSHERTAVHSMEREGSDDVNVSVFSSLASLCQTQIMVFVSLANFMLAMLTVLKSLNSPCSASSLCLHFFSHFLSWEG